MKKFISGLIIGLVLATATSVTAASGILAQFADFNLVVNGQAKVLQTKPLVYNGTSYLPVREIANLVGYDVTYKADSRTIELNTVTATSTIQTPVQDIKDPTEPISNTVNMADWISLRELSSQGVSVIIDKETIISKGDKTLIFPLNTTTLIGVDTKGPIFFHSVNGSTLMHYKSSLYLKSQIYSY